MSSSNELAVSQRKNKGRRKVRIVKMENQSNLQVTFSKRRAGLFKKASELCTLCGAEAAIVVFSPANKVYCFGHPNAKVVFDRFTIASEGSAHEALSRNNAMSQMVIEAHRNSTIRELNLELTQLESMLRAERKHSEDLHLIREAGLMQRWFPGSLDKFDHTQLGVLKEAIMGFKKSFENKVQRNMIDINNHAYQVPINNDNIENGGNPNFDFSAFGAPTSFFRSHYDSFYCGNHSLQFDDNGMVLSEGVGHFNSATQSTSDNYNWTITGQDPMSFIGGDDRTLASNIARANNGVGNEGFDMLSGFYTGHGARMF